MPRAGKQGDAILQAAAGLPAPFTVEDLVIAAWSLDPETFGLRGYPEHPDSNKIGATLAGTRGLVARGLLDRVAARTYTLTELGRLLVEWLNNDQMPLERPAAPPAAIGEGCCRQCGKPARACERHAYGGKCEVCWSVALPSLAG